MIPPLLRKGLEAIMNDHAHNQPSGANPLAEISIETLYNLSLMRSPVFFLEDEARDHHQFHVNVRSLTGRMLSFTVSSAVTVQQLKAMIQSKEGIPEDQQRLILAGKQLGDEEKTLGEYGITEDGVLIHLVLRCRGGGPPEYRFNGDFLHSEFDYDLTDEKSDGRQFVRGGKVYFRPVGWYRYALKVLGHFNDDVWFGPNGIRQDSTPGEWAVSYHGTSRCNGKSIAEEGYQLAKCKRFAYGHGIYSTPSIDIAMGYAPEFMHEGKSYRIIMQNRVNPTTVQVIKIGPGEANEYWVTANQKDIRPYGILIRPV